MESFFGTLKAEFFHLNRFDNIDQLKPVSGDTSGTTTTTASSSAKGLSPVQYRTQAFGL